MIKFSWYIIIPVGTSESIVQSPISDVLSG